MSNRYTMIERLAAESARRSPKPTPQALLPIDRLNHSLAAVGEPESGAVEGLRGVAMRLMTTSIEDRSRVLAVVSPERGDGRSFVAANLAIVFAQAGQHTLLIDADLRAPSQHALFQCEAGLGLCALLQDDDQAYPTRSIDGLPALQVLTAGESPSAGDAASLGGVRFQSLLEELRQAFDQIIIDTPPGGRYTDAETVATRAGAALLVVRRNVTRLASARRLADSISAAGATVLGTVVNRR